MIITIDGPAGTGKSTVAKMLAQRVNFVFFDTGAMYRAVTYKILQKNIPITDAVGISELLSDFLFRIETTPQEKRYFIGEEDVTEAIRSQQVTRFVSEVSALSFIREALVTMQRRFAMQVDAVFEGRDMGSVVFPEADLKIYLTARPDVRAERRFRELLYKHPSDAENLTKQQVLEDILRRDTIDSSRAHSPLKPAADAHIIDTSDLNIDEVIQKILSLLVHKR